MDKMTLDKLEYSTNHAAGIEHELGKPVALINCVTKTEGSTVYSGMNIAVAPNGNVVVKSNWDKFLHVLAPDGDHKDLTRWSFNIGDAVDQHVAVGTNGDIFVKAYGRNITATRDDGSVYILSLHEVKTGEQVTGAETWRYQLNSKQSSPSSARSVAPILTHDTVFQVYNRDADGISVMCALDRKSGNEIWKEEFGKNHLGRPVPGQSKNFFVPYHKYGANYNDLYGLLEISYSGKIIQDIEQNPENDKLMIISVGEFGDIFAVYGHKKDTGAIDHLQLYKFKKQGDRYDKSLLMTFSPELEYQANAVIIGLNDTLYIPTMVMSHPGVQPTSEEHWDSQLWAIDAAGKVVWKYSIDGLLMACPTLTEEGSLYLSCLRNPTQDEQKKWITTAEVHALDTRKGAFCWVTGIKCIENFADKLSVYPLFSSPTVGHDGTVYIGAEITEPVVHQGGTDPDPQTHACLIALRAHEQLATSAPWPIEHGNAGCSGTSPMRPL